jgi:hypothetical protein
MLGKLIRHEFQATARHFLPMYLGLAIITLLLKVSLILDLGGFQSDTYNRGFFLVLINTLLIIFYVVAIIALFVLTLVIILRRFYSNLFGDEGYLMFTLPVTTTQLLNSKLIVALIWEIITIPIVCLSFFILFFQTDILGWFPYACSRAIEGIRFLSFSGYRVWLLIAEFVIGLILQNIVSILMFYLSITLGQKLMPARRFLGSIVAFLVVYIVTELLSSLITMLSQFSASITMTGNFDLSDTMHYLGVFFPTAIVENLIFCILYYTLTHYLIDKKLNLN